MTRKMSVPVHTKAFFYSYIFRLQLSKSLLAELIDKIYYLPLSFCLFLLISLYLNAVHMCAHKGPDKYIHNHL